MLQIHPRPARRAFPLLLALSLGLAAGACNSRSTAPEPAPRRVATTAPSAQETVGYLASDELEGRGVGTKGIDAAADYIANRFKQAGLRPVSGADGYFQNFSIMTGAVVNPKSSLAAGDESFKLHEQFRPMSFSTSGTFDAPVAFAGYGISSEKLGYDDYAGLDVRRKVVLAMRFEPHTSQGKSRFAPKDNENGNSDNATLDSKARVAADKGAAALLLVTPPTFHDKEKALLPLAGGFAGGQAKIPIVQVMPDVANALLKQAGAPALAELQKSIDDAGKPASRELTGTTVRGDIRVVKVSSPVKNVVAVLPGGRHKNEYVVVGAHYDHLGRGLFARAGKGAIHNGADDNASGTTVLMQLAERIAQSKHKPDRSILFVAFTGEEMGLLGSNEFVKHPPVPLDKIAAMINLDMVGRVRDEMLYIGGDGTAPAFAAILKAADDASPLKLKSIGSGGLGPSDHMSFALKRIPVLFLFSGMHGDYHRPTDDAEQVNYAGIAEVTDFTSDLVRRVAAMPKQQYASGTDTRSFMGGNPHGGGGPGSMSGGPPRVTLGVVPDYSSDEIAGLRISGVVPGSPAEAAGLRDGDVIVKFNERTIANIYDLSEALANGKAGQDVKLIVKRDGAETELHATLAEKG